MCPRLMLLLFAQALFSYCKKTILRIFDNRDNAIRRQKPNLSRQGERIRHILYSLCVATLHIMPATNPSMNITHRIRFV